MSSESSEYPVTLAYVLAKGQPRGRELTAPKVLVAQTLTNTRLYRLAHVVGSLLAHLAGHRPVRLSCI